MEAVQQKDQSLCKYCETSLRVIEPLTIVHGDSETSPIKRTHVCDDCGASVIDRKSPQSGDCVLEIPREYRFALDQFYKRLDILRDFEVLDYESPIYCVLDANSEFGDHQNHELHGDGFVIPLCTCSRLTIHFDGHVVLRVHKERFSPWDPERVERTSEHNGSFENLRHRLDELIFDETQLSEIQDLITIHLAHHEGPYFCDGGRDFSSLVYWRMVGEVDYPQRYKVVRDQDLER